MRHVLSVRALLDATVHAVEGIPVARIHDLIWDQAQAKVTHLLLSPLDETDLAPARVYAIHHSFFFTGEVENTLTYSPKIGKEESAFFIQLPPRYDELEPEDVASFNRYVRGRTRTAGHRSDND